MTWLLAFHSKFTASPCIKPLVLESKIATCRFQLKYNDGIVRKSLGNVRTLQAFITQVSAETALQWLVGVNLFERVVSQQVQ